jgi:hypothetical protein
MVTTKALTALEVPGYKIHTRDSYFKEFGKPAPPADPTKRPKAWIGNGSFFFVRGMTLIRDTVPPNENDVNIEGAGPFPKYVVIPTRASVDGAGGQPYNALYLSFEKDARELMAALNGTNFRDAGVNPFLPLFYPPEELRREWEFDSPQTTGINVGAMLLVRHMPGVGSPGHWDTTSQALPLWVPELHPMPKDMNNPWSAPCRGLAANEKIGPSGIFGLPTLFIEDGKTDPNQPTSGGGFTQADRDLLRRLAAVFSIS